MVVEKDLTVDIFNACFVNIVAILKIVVTLLGLGDVV